MSVARQSLLWIGIAVFVASAFFPALPFRAGDPDVPPHMQPGDADVILIGPPAPLRTPADEIARAVSKGTGQAFWVRRPFYVYALVPLWVLALLLARKSRRLAGALLLATTLGILVLEAFYLHSDYRSFLPGVLGSIEAVAAYVFVCAVLLYRQPGAWRLTAIEATIGAQALLGFVHALTLPFTMAREWVRVYELSVVASTVNAHVHAGFWIGCAGLLLIALPAYVGRPSDAA